MKPDPEILDTKSVRQSSMRGPALQMESSCQAVKTMAAQFGTATSSQCQRIEDAVAGMRMTRPPQFASQEPCVEVGVMRDQTRGARIPEESKEVRQHLPRGWRIRQICVRDAVYGLGSRRHRPAGIDELLELVGHLSRPAESDGTDLHHPVTLGHQSCRLKIKRDVLEVRVAQCSQFAFPVVAIHRRPFFRNKTRSAGNRLVSFYRDFRRRSRVRSSCLSLGGRPVLKQPTAWPIFSVTLCGSDSLA